MRSFLRNNLVLFPLSFTVACAGRTNTNAEASLKEPWKSVRASPAPLVGDDNNVEIHLYKKWEDEKLKIEQSLPAAFIGKPGQRS